MDAGPPGPAAARAYVSICSGVSLSRNAGDTLLSQVIETGAIDVNLISSGYGPVDRKTIPEGYRVWVGTEFKDLGGNQNVYVTRQTGGVVGVRPLGLLALFVVHRAAERL